MIRDLPQGINSGPERVLITRPEGVAQSGNSGILISTDDKARDYAPCTPALLYALELNCEIKCKIETYTTTQGEEQLKVSLLIG